MKHDSLITLITFDNGFQANLLKAKLNDAGIESFIFDENIMTLNPLYNNMVGGIKLKIYESDLEDARDLLKEIEDTPISDERDVEVKCPRCGSGKLMSGIKSVNSLKSLMAYIAAVLTLTFPLYSDSIYYCINCNHKFGKELQ